MRNLVRAVICSLGIFIIIPVHALASCTSSEVVGTVRISTVPIDRLAGTEGGIKARAIFTAEAACISFFDRYVSGAAGVITRIDNGKMIVGTPAGFNGPYQWCSGGLIGGGCQSAYKTLTAVGASVSCSVERTGDCESQGFGGDQGFSYNTGLIWIRDVAAYPGCRVVPCEEGCDWSGPGGAV